jgi:hypothetical protein
MMWLEAEVVHEVPSETTRGEPKTFLKLCNENNELTRFSDRGKFSSGEPTLDIQGIRRERRSHSMSVAVTSEPSQAPWERSTTVSSSGPVGTMEELDAMDVGGGMGFECGRPVAEKKKTHEQRKKLRPWRTAEWRAAVEKIAVAAEREQRRGGGAAAE